MVGQNGHRDALKLALSNMPEVMASLMKEFILNKDITSRIQIRLRMKALLDFAGVDTEYPPNPLIKKEAENGAQPAREAAMQDGRAAGLQYSAPGQVTAFGPTEGAMPPTPPRVGIDNAEIIQ
jgi:hypothetical protein